MIAEHRFWSKVEPTGFCWNWTRALSHGYGTYSVGGKKRRAHRVAYEFLVGPIPEGLELDHLCRNRACVNPDHLEPVTRAENAARTAPARPKKTHCPQGHEYSEENTYVYGTSRYCKRCAFDRMANRSKDKNNPGDKPEKRGGWW